MNAEDAGNLLRLAAAEDGNLAAPDRVEARVMAVFRARRAARARRRIAVWAVAAAASIVAVVTVARRETVPIPPRPAIRNAITPGTVAGKVVESGPRRKSPPLKQSARNIVRELPAPRPAAPAVSPIESPVVAAVPTGAPREVVTRFYPLMDSAPPLERAAILRVRVPASAMQAVGLPVREERLDDPVQADIVVGEEGLPRAIRFVAFPVR
jgi:hypothetical protein